MADEFTGNIDEARDFSKATSAVVPPSDLAGFAAVGDLLVKGGAQMIDRGALRGFQKKVDEIDAAQKQGAISFEDSLLKLNALTRSFAADRPHLAQDARGLASQAAGVDVNKQLAAFELQDMQSQEALEQRFEQQIQDTLFEAGVDPKTLTPELQRLNALKLMKNKSKLALINSGGNRETAKAKAQLAFLDVIDVNGGAAIHSVLSTLDLKDPNAVAAARAQIASYRASMHSQIPSFVRRMAKQTGNPSVVEAADKMRTDVDAQFDAVENFFSGNLEIKKEALETLQVDMDLDLFDSLYVIEKMKESFGEIGMKELLLEAKTNKPEAHTKILEILGQSSSKFLSKMEKASGKGDGENTKNRRKDEEVSRFYDGETDFANLSTTAKTRIVPTLLTVSKKIQSTPDHKVSQEDLNAWVRMVDNLSVAAKEVKGNTDNVKNAMAAFIDPTWIRTFDKAIGIKGVEDTGIKNVGANVLHTATTYLMRVGERNTRRQAERGNAQLAYDPVLKQYVLQDDLDVPAISKVLPDMTKASSDFMDRQQAIKDLNELNRVLNLGMQLRKFDPKLSSMSEELAAQTLAMSTPSVPIARGRVPIKGAQEETNLKASDILPSPNDADIVNSLDALPVGQRITRDGKDYIKKADGTFEEVTK